MTMYVVYVVYVEEVEHRKTIPDGPANERTAYAERSSVRSVPLDNI